MFKQMFKVPSALSIASRELEEAKRNLLATQATAEHAALMVEYYSGVVTRLSNYIKVETSLTE